MIKPEAVAAGHGGKIIDMIISAGYRIVALKYTHLSAAEAGTFYEVHKERPFYPGLVKFMTSSPVVALVLEGIDAIAVCRNLMGKTNARESAPGTIRGDFGMSRSYNLVHGSDGPEAAAREIGLFFPEGVVAWNASSWNWAYDPVEELPKS